MSSKGGEVHGRHGERPDGGTPPARTSRLPSGFSSIRDLLSFLAGVGIIGNEVFISDRVEIAFLTVGVALTGLPLVFGADEKR